ncbi:hypothetical protein COD57_26885 [Escherichia coli]|nr:hypothetical protein COD58_27105 [Escherichia coli]PBR27761.1 hypothetical protein COD57_26885 [Escherichia coli]PBR49228.1 hypothetical protein COD46_27755 [Escherichia coli]PBR79928.1 hypothetical protein COD26_27695 [Escherichia coli]PBR85537.1 hypothetical protein COD25_27170 [Escherichia coli]
MLDNESNYCKVIPSTNRIVVRLKFRYPALRGNRGFLSGRSQTSEWKASRDRQRSSNGALY